MIRRGPDKDTGGNDWKDGLLRQTRTVKRALKKLLKIRVSVVDDHHPMRNITLSLSREVAREGNVLGGIFYSGLGYQTPSLG